MLVDIMTDIQSYGSIRKYGRVVFFSLLTFGIYYIFYLFWQFRDLDEHFKRAFEVEAESYPTKINPTTMIIFLILFPIYPIYIKYQLLHEHIATSNIRGKENCTVAYEAVVVFLVFGICTLGVLPIIHEHRWQKAFNDHILAHKKHAKRKRRKKRAD